VFGRRHMTDEYSEKLCDERHARVDTLHDKQDEQTIILTEIREWTLNHAESHSQNRLNLTNLITSLLAVAAVLVSIFALKG